MLYTVITAVYALIMYLFYGDSLIDAERVFLFFVFAVLFSGANWIARLSVLSAPLRFLFHFLICTLAFYLCFLLPLAMPASTALIGVFLFVVLYFIIAGIFFGIRSRFRKNLEAGTKYERQYPKKK